MWYIAGVDSENLSDTATDPDSVPVVVQALRRRRLVLVPQPSGGTPQSVQDLPCSTAIDVPDSHDDRLRRVRQVVRHDAPQGTPREVVQGGTSPMLHRQARAAQILIQELSRRVGSLPGGTSIPRIVREQRWSPLNVPLMWAAAADVSTPHEFVLGEACRFAHAWQCWKWSSSPPRSSLGDRRCQRVNNRTRRCDLGRSRRTT